MKKLIYTAAFTMIVASLAPSAQAAAHLHSLKTAHGNFNSSHIVHSGAHPNNARFQGATHHFEVHVQGKALSALAIDLPQDVRISGGIEVKNQLGKKIDAKVSVNNRKATVVFSQPVPPETTISIDMLGINTSGYSHDWEYMVYGTMVGLNAEISLGYARIQTY